MGIPHEIAKSAKNETEKVILEALWANGRYWSNKIDNYKDGSKEWQECNNNLIKVEQIIDRFVDGKIRVVEVEE